MNAENTPFTVEKHLYLAFLEMCYLLAYLMKIERRKSKNELHLIFP